MVFFGSGFSFICSPVGFKFMIWSEGRATMLGGAKSCEMKRGLVLRSRALAARHGGLFQHRRCGVLCQQEGRRVAGSLRKRQRALENQIELFCEARGFG